MLQKVEREAPLNLAWAVEEGFVSYSGDVWTEKRILSRHGNQKDAITALYAVMKGKERS
jgi:hypothetical protein